MMYYSDERAREMELAAAERQMGCSCSPFGRMISRAVKGSNGRERRAKKDRFDYAMAYPPAQTHYVRPNARTITVATNNHQPSNAYAHAVPPEPTRAYAATAAAPQASAGKPRKKKKKKRVTFNPEVGRMPGNAAPPHAGYQPQHAAVTASVTGAHEGSAYHHGAAEPYSPAPPPVHGQGHAYGYYGYGYGRYAPSPLPRFEVVGTPRRHEYFSGEYRWYYPTPVRESIYSFATDANHRLTNFFSEENPNACTIV
ncbi:hypothetical protein EJB05_44956 [Eragrostis curvula]|uniref:Uncharacterized protein n=1 Tax=Eragrostis curvula TaxID=38414 RepID=A0A5J9TJB7_9POAL|nr:hypothetical protein EJB05_44956 [Eragrostis curvula]